MADTIVVVGLEVGDDFTTIAAAFAAVPSDLTVTGGNYIIQVRNDQTHSARHIFPTVTQDATHRLELTAVPGDEVDGSGVGTVIENDNSFFGVIEFSNDFDKVSNVGVIQRNASATASTFKFLGGITDLSIDNCFVSGVQMQNGSDGVADITNCIIADGNGGGFGGGNVDGTYTFDRCTFVNNASYGVGFNSNGSATFPVTNCLSLDNGGDDYEVDASGDFNASSDATAPGATVFINRIITDDLEDPLGVTPNYNLKATSTLVGAGSGGSDIGATIGQATISASISGTATDNITEDDIVTGGKTIIITLASDTWVADGTTFDDQRQNIIDGITSNQSEATGWNNEVRDNEVVTAVARTSDTVVTVTLTASPSYDITLQETIVTTVPASALVTSTSAIVATPNFTVDPVSATFKSYFATNNSVLI